MNYHNIKNYKLFLKESIENDKEKESILKLINHININLDLHVDEIIEILTMGLKEYYDESDPLLLKINSFSGELKDYHFKHDKNNDYNDILNICHQAKILLDISLSNFLTIFEIGYLSTMSEYDEQILKGIKDAKIILNRYRSYDDNIDYRLKD